MISINPIYQLLFSTSMASLILVILGIFLVRVLTKKEDRSKILRLLNVARRFKWLIILFFIIYFEKNWVDLLNHPIRYFLGLDFTNLIYEIEGNFVYYYQNLFESKFLTAVLAPLYLLAYIFVNYFAVIYFAFRRESLLATKMALNYMVIYIISIPFYLFLPVDVTYQRVPGVKALLYRYHPLFNEFFSKADPFDNCFPSLHIAIPFSLFLLIWHYRKRTGDKRFDRYLYLIIGLNVLFAFSILYLGVHWLVDIIGGLLFGWLGWIMVETLASRYQRLTSRTDRNIRLQLRSVIFRKDTPSSFKGYIGKKIERRKRRCLIPFCGNIPDKRFFLRSTAAFIDIVIVIIPGILLFDGVRLSFTYLDDFWLFSFMLYFVYFGVFEYLFHTTPGKAIFGLRIVSLRDVRWAVRGWGKKGKVGRGMGGMGKGRTVKGEKGKGRTVKGEKGKGRTVKGEKGKGRTVKGEKGKGRTVKGEKGKGRTGRMGRGERIHNFSKIHFGEIVNRTVYRLFYFLILLDYAASYLLRLQKHYYQKRTAGKEDVAAEMADEEG